MAYVVDNITVSIRATRSEEIFSWLINIPVNNEDELEQMDVHPNEKYIVGIITLVFAFLNFTVAFAVTLALFRLKSMRNSFGYLNISHGIADCLVLTMFILWFAPMIMINSELGHTPLGIRLSQLVGVFMCGSVHSAIVIAMGRYIALVHPFRYSLLFSTQNTIIFALVAWALGIFQYAPTFFPQCFYYFDFRYYAWIYIDTQCGQFLSWFSDLCYGFVMLTLVGGPNLATIYELHKASKAGNALGTLEAVPNRRQRQEWRFFLQAFSTSTIIMIIFMGFHLVKKSMSLRSIHFLMSCLCVILVHGTNSIVLLACSSELRNWLLQRIAMTKPPMKYTLSSVQEELCKSKISPVTRLSMV